jgi:hypothetical protein
MFYWLKCSSSRLPAFAAALLLSLTVLPASATVTCRVPQRINGVEQQMPPWFSGTNSSISWEVESLPKSAHLTHIMVYINGTVVRDINIDPEIGTMVIATGVVPFDSTHFPDGQTITVRAEGTNSIGETGYVEGTAPAYNKAFVFGNVVPNLGGLGTLYRGNTADQYMSSELQTMHHTTTPASPTAAIQQTAGSIKSAIPPNTVICAYTHGMAGQFGDSATINVAGVWVTAAQVSAKIAEKTSAQPPCHFVFMGACYTASDTQLALAFQVGGIYGPVQNTAYFGWSPAVEDDPHFLTFIQSFFGRLSAGDTVRAASNYARDHGGGLPVDENGLPLEPVIIGDETMKVHGIYGGIALNWWL